MIYLTNCLPSSDLKLRFSNARPVTVSSTTINPVPTPDFSKVEYINPLYFNGYKTSFNCLRADTYIFQIAFELSTALLVSAGFTVNIYNKDGELYYTTFLIGETTSKSVVYSKELYIGVEDSLSLLVTAQMTTTSVPYYQIPAGKMTFSIY